MTRELNKELNTYLSRRPKKSHKPFFTKKPKKETYAEYDAFIGVSETKPTVILGKENVWDNLKRSVKPLLKKMHHAPPEDAPAFDNEGNIIASEDKTQVPPTVIQRSGQIVTNIFSKLDVFDVIGKKSEAAAEYAEMKEFGEVIETSNDVKELARVSANILRLLPPEKLEEFKRGNDFKSYKDILKKHQIIK